MNRIIGLGSFIIASLYLAYFYLTDIVKYYEGRFNYDGIRYLIPVAVADALFLIALLFLYFTWGFNRYFLFFVLFAGLHNLNFGFDIEYIPFVGGCTVLATFIFIARLKTKE